MSERSERNVAALYSPRSGGELLTGVTVSVPSFASHHDDVEHQ